MFAVELFLRGEWRWARLGVPAFDSVASFFSRGNVGVLGKVLRACELRSHGNVRVYGSGLNDLPIRLAVRND